MYFLCSFICENYVAFGKNATRLHLLTKMSNVSPLAVFRSKMHICWNTNNLLHTQNNVCIINICATKLDHPIPTIESWIIICQPLKVGSFYTDHWKLDHPILAFGSWSFMYQPLKAGSSYTKLLKAGSSYSN